MLPLKQPVSKPIYADTAKPMYHQQQPSYAATEMIKPEHYRNAYNGFESCQQSNLEYIYSGQSSYPNSNQPEYCSPMPFPNFPQQGYQPQICQEPLASYHNSQYTTWYPNTEHVPKQIQNTVQPPRHYIRDWLRNVEDNAHLQKTFEQIEKESDTGCQKTNHLSKEQLTTCSSNVYSTQQNQTQDSSPQLPMLKNCSDERLTCQNTSNSNQLSIAHEESLKTENKEAPFNSLSPRNCSSS